MIAASPADFTCSSPLHQTASRLGRVTLSFGVEADGRFFAELSLLDLVGMSPCEAGQPCLCDEGWLVECGNIVAVEQAVETIRRTASALPDLRAGLLDRLPFHPVLDREPAARVLVTSLTDQGELLA